LANSGSVLGAYLISGYPLAMALNVIAPHLAATIVMNATRRVLRRPWLSSCQRRSPFCAPPLPKGASSPGGSPGRGR
jgi:hypothetical protein